MADETKEASQYQSTCDKTQSFLNSEREYVENGLRVGFETFLNRLEVHNKLNQSIISDDDINVIFSNYRTLYNANNKLFDDLMSLRLDGITKLRDNLGKLMVDFIPYFRIYTDYIVKKQGAITHLDKLKKSNRRFRQFLRINEACAGRKLKVFLEEPAGRLPQYLQHLAGVYVAFERESTKTESEAALKLLQAIVDIKQVTDEIAVKCRDLKARLLVGALQKDVFGNRIQLLAAHRYCVSHASMNMVVHDKNDRIKMHKFVLCNDILVVSTLASSFKSGQLIAVYPLIGLRILRDPKISDALVESTDSEKVKYRFALVPQNKNFIPSTDTSNSYVGSLIIISDNRKQLERWIETIEDTVDEEEHNLKPCNPVDLELRLRKQKTSKEGTAETITITDVEKIKEIEAWKAAKASGNPLPPIRSSSAQKAKTTINANANASDTTSFPALPHRAPPKKTNRTKSIGNRTPAKPPSKPPSKPPPRRGTLNAHKRQRSGPLPPGKHAPGAPKTPPPPGGPPPGGKLPGKLQKRKFKTTVSPHPTLKENTETKENTKKKETKEVKGTGVVPLKRTNSRKSMLAGIQGFKSKSLKHVDAETLKKEAVAQPANVTNLLQTTLKNYRQFVMDDDDSDDSDGSWDD